MPTLTSRAGCGEDRCPILGLRPRRIRRTSRGQRKGPLRAPRPPPLRRDMYDFQILEDVNEITEEKEDKSTVPQSSLQASNTAREKE
ncbi:hypothetical protein NDU88_002880 [Pleurodeles waltl]|uniref:Uncharacterized protein n=1 Tax=Pleurodeles waltl TaxID=8319 RepID=A0AAV7WQS8_PLEWA|nr:hypothetical protein NDU88_002880 [Pleurodeles waltl]